MGYPLDSGSHYLLWSPRRRFGGRHHRRVGGRRSGNCLLHEPIKQLAATFAGSAIEAKRKFIKVIIEMLLLNPTLKRTEQPSLEQRSDIMDARHDFVSLFDASANGCNDMLVACSGKLGTPCVRLVVASKI